MIRLKIEIKIKSKGIKHAKLKVCQKKFSIKSPKLDLKLLDEVLVSDFGRDVIIDSRTSCNFL